MRESGPRDTILLSTFRFPQQVICYFNKNARNNSIISKNASNRSIVMGRTGMLSIAENPAMSGKPATAGKEQQRKGATAIQTF